MKMSTFPSDKAQPPAAKQLRALLRQHSASFNARCFEMIGLPLQMSKLLLLPPSVIANSALVNTLSLEEARPPSPPSPSFIAGPSHRLLQVKAAYSAEHSSSDRSSCSDAVRVVRQLYVSALESGDIDSWKAALLQESDLDAAHVEAIVHSIQVFAYDGEPMRSSTILQADSSAASQIRVRQVLSLSFRLESFSWPFFFLLLSFCCSWAPSSGKYQWWQRRLLKTPPRKVRVLFVARSLILFF